MRGWSIVAADGFRMDLVLPAHAGVILKGFEYEEYTNSITRTCGGDPS